MLRRQSGYTGGAGGAYPTGRNPACTTLFLGDGNKQLEKSFLSAKANVVLRNDGTYGIDVDTLGVKDRLRRGAVEDPERPGRGWWIGGPDGTFPLQVQRLTQHLFGSADQGTESAADDLPFMTMPTSCGAKTLSSDATFHASGTVFTDGFGFTPTGCDTVPFNPQIVGSIDGSGGNSREGGHPAVDVTIKQALGEAATKTAAVQLPPLFGVSLPPSVTHAPRPTFRPTRPPGATVGSAVATSPLSPTPLAGPVLLVEVPNALPKLSVFLFGVANVRLDGNVTLVNGALVNTFDNIAELPLTSFRLTLNGGQGGLLQNSQDLCTGVGSLSGTFTGYNGATVPATAPLTGIGIEPCIAAAARKPKAKITLRDVDSGDPRLNVLIRRGSTADASLLTRARVLLPKGLRADRGDKGKLRVNASARLRGSTLRLTRKALIVKRVPGGDSPRIRARFPKGTIHASKGLQGKIGKRVRFRLRVKTKSGRTFKVNVRVKVRA